MLTLPLLLLSRLHLLVRVQDLNAQPLLLEQLDASFDAVLCVNGLQYLTQPELVLTEVGAVLPRAWRRAHRQQPAQHCMRDS